ncbi:unnamed protein product [Adineta steineri]|uniref:ABC transmembrane type-1 domain-containing protein n=1 Tax=Adineta steineri TaxID=433720 RepID=A0A814I2T1_9BILA|nr:unnamed protein product [Adineta steineri]CAF1267230.1 unnamed protein product [Adineta steineri]
MNKPEWIFILCGCICNGAIQLVTGIVLSKLTASFFFGCSGKALTKRLRIKTFEISLRQDISYFDDLNNNTGTLCTRLSTEATAVQDATGIRFGILLQSFYSLADDLIRYTKLQNQQQPSKLIL